MARPRRNQDGPSAQERIQEAFWVMMGEMPYEAITVTALAKRAGVNHNTIYYYYENTDQLALKLMEENIPENIGEIFGTVLVDGKVFFERLMADPVHYRRWRRMCCFILSESSLLLEKVKEKLIETWCKAMGTRPEDLTGAQRMDLEFIFSGMISVMKLALVEQEFGSIPSLLERPLGQGIRATLASLKQDTSP